jgi:ketosteroid isomerase-like protein
MMRTLAFYVIAAATLLISACKPKTETCNDQVLADSLLKINVSAYNSGNAQKIADLFTDDALLIGNGKFTWTKDSILVWAKSVAPAIKNFRGYLGPTTVTEDMVIMTKYWTMDFVPQGAVMPAKGLSTIVWKKQADKTWKTVLENSQYDIKPF